MSARIQRFATVAYLFLFSNEFLSTECSYSHLSGPFGGSRGGDGGTIIIIEDAKGGQYFPIKFEVLISKSPFN